MCECKCGCKKVDGIQSRLKDQIEKSARIELAQKKFSEGLMELSKEFLKDVAGTGIYINEIIVGYDSK